jgi:hypothetical protein
LFYQRPICKKIQKNQNKKITLPNTSGGEQFQNSQMQLFLGFFFRETSLADLYSIFIDRYFLQQGLLLQQNGLCGQLAS